MVIPGLFLTWNPMLKLYCSSRSGLKVRSMSIDEFASTVPAYELIMSGILEPGLEIPYSPISATLLSFSVLLVADSRYLAIDFKNALRSIHHSKGVLSVFSMWTICVDAVPTNWGRNLMLE